MDYQEDYKFWRLVYQLITEHDYRLIQMSTDQKEIWLEKSENKQAQLIRILQKDLDWSNWMQRDIQLTASNGERVRKQMIRGEVNVVNIYVSAYPPVDDYEFRLDSAYLTENQKTNVHSYIIDRTNVDQELVRIGSRLQIDLDIPIITDQFDQAAEALKRDTLSYAVQKVKSEKSLFEYGKPFFTYLFIIVQVAMFLLLEAAGGSTNTSTLIKYGAKFNPLILEGEWWRFITPIFLHIGVLHLLMNTLALYFLGVAVEKIFGNSRFLFIYIVAGLFGSLASFLFSPNISAGASGAIFGCFGALLYFGLIYPKLFFRTMGMNVIVVIAINLVFGFTVPGIDNAGHIGGLVGGFLATGIVHFPKKKKPIMQLLFLVGSGLLVGGILAYGFNHPNQMVDEQSIAIMAKEYVQMEEYEKAEDLLTEYIDENQSSTKILFLLSFAEIKSGNLTDAKAHLIKVIELDTTFHEAYYNLALIYLDENDVANAKRNVEAALKINPEQDDYRKLLQDINEWEKDFGGGQ
ncbi:rhomboid family intramembrane serine protease [Cytobacillus spongiae]|uniref:rhomboid family intramembrane serine protease n=1 Tax=Cytobacillus spongiae TaxID=2901381 RepID=UPI001F2FC3EC|nr:rhomboid family intramembrane serine protease [Cytobacillus spongiae]UII54860.1 rhomboid family intramembrane serine protease [Cytobacillus spongiae]